MLNYVWLSLIILGIASALYVDLSDISTNKYHNNEPITIDIKFASNFAPDSSGSYRGSAVIDAKIYNKAYHDSIRSAFSLPVILSINHKEGTATLLFSVTDNTPALWKTMAETSGDKDKITAKLTSFQTLNPETIKATVILEEITFVKLKDVTNETINIAGVAVKIALGLIGIMALWLGVMKVAEDAGLINKLANVIKPVTKKLFPDVPPDHPAVGAMLMNISANMLGLGNAATPFGLKAMEELDKLNPNKGTATNAMVTFLAINTAGLTLIPATAIAVRAAAGSSDPAIIIGPSIFGATCATITGIVAAKLFQKFPVRKGEWKNWWQENWKLTVFIIALAAFFLIATITGLLSIIGSLFTFIGPNMLKTIMKILSTIAIPFLIAIFIGYGAFKKVNVYDQFIEGAKEGFNIAVRIIPYLVAMLVAIGIFRAGGALDNLFIPVVRIFTDAVGMPPEALPMALIRPLSGSGSLGVMAEIISVYGADSFIGVLVSTFFGSTETTFYVLAVYFGAVNIRRTRHALVAGLLADVAGILGALFIVKLLFGT
ncbi:spore maturation protein A [bacterium BMS3Abin03]|nr:spore maturation protein A [bacterium BMS3Abin03]